MEVASVSRPSARNAARARGLEVSCQLRMAVMDGDEARITRLLSELLRIQGLTRGQRVSLQLKALLNLVQTLRSVALNDEVTGLYNRRGFVQTATRLLDLATRDGQPAYLVYFDVGQLRLINDTVGHSAGDVLIRQMGNFMRDLFPSYGVYEVLGRLTANEFAALTTSPTYASRSAVLLRARRPQRSCDVPSLPLRVGVAPFNPSRPVAIDELLDAARQALNEPDRISRITTAPDVVARHEGLSAVSRL
jgi:diguanylate cyclase (GGDEF)-like protein